MSLVKTRLKINWLQLATLLLLAVLVGLYLIFRGHAASATCTQTLAAGSSAMTIQNAVNTAAGGSVICLPAGTYPALSFTGSNNRTDYATLQASPGASVITGEISVNTGAYFSFDGFILPGVHIYGTSNGGVSHHIKVLNNTTNSDNVYVAEGDHDVLIEGNTIIGHNSMGVTASTSSSNPLIYNITIRGNTFKGNVGGGSYSEDGIRLGWFDNVLIENNDLSGVNQVTTDPAGNHNDVLQAVWGGSNLTFRNNYLHNNSGQGFFLKDPLGNNPKCATPANPNGNQYCNVYFENNLIVHSTVQDAEAAPGFTQNQFQVFDTHNIYIFNNTIWDNEANFILRYGVSGVVMKNNIIQTVQTYDTWDFAGNVTSDYNLSQNWNGSFNTGTHDLTASPTWVNPNNATEHATPANWNYRLAAGSKGIDVGTNSSGINGYAVPALDKEGKTRIDIANIANGASGFYDMGAFEYGSTGGTLPPSDLSPPSVPITAVASLAPVANSVNTNVSLSWAGSTDNVGVTGYTIYRDGIQVGTSTTASYADISPPVGTHSYTVSAYDAAGNTSAASIASNFLTIYKTADLNHDGAINILDLSTLLSRYNTTDVTSDINHSGFVDIVDLSILLSRYGG